MSVQDGADADAAGADADAVTIDRDAIDDQFGEHITGGVEVSR